MLGTTSIRFFSSIARLVFMVPLKLRGWKQMEKQPVYYAADDEAADEDEASNKSMEYTYFAFVSKVKAS